MDPRHKISFLGFLVLIIGVSPALCSELGGLEDASGQARELLKGARTIGASSRAQAQAASPADGTLSYASVCGGDGAALADRRAQRLMTGLKALEPQLRPRFAALAAKYGLPAQNGADYIDSTLRSITYTYPQSVDKAKAALSAFAEAIEQAVLSRVAAPDHARIKAALTSRIQTRSSLSAEAKAALVRRVELTMLALPSRYIREYLTTTDELWPVVSLLAADQAWNASYDDLGGASNPALTPDQSLIIVFPGFLLAEDRGNGSSGVDYVLAHETAHSIDSGRFPGLYRGYIDCMKERNGQDFKSWDEVMADTWAAETLAVLSSSAGAKELGKSFEIVCGTSGEGADPILGNLTQSEHPSGQYRIERILASNADLRHSLGLPPASPAACGL